MVELNFHIKQSHMRFTYTPPVIVFNSRLNQLNFY